jgi:hypothetical protein
VKERRGKRRKQLLDDLQEIRGWGFKEKVLDRILWRSSSGRGCEPAVRLRNERLLFAPADIVFIFCPRLLSYLTDFCFAVNGTSLN